MCVREYSSTENGSHLSQRNDISTSLCVIAGKLESFHRYRSQNEAAVLALHTRRFYEVLLYAGLDISSSWQRIGLDVFTNGGWPFCKTVIQQIANSILDYLSTNTHTFLFIVTVMFYLIDIVNGQKNKRSPINITVKIIRTLFV